MTVMVIMSATVQAGNWFAMAFSVLLINPFGAFGFLFYIALTLSLYGIQYYRFAKVGEVTLKILNSNTTT
jgi:hypothetical protein